MDALPAYVVPADTGSLPTFPHPTEGAHQCPNCQPYLLYRTRKNYTLYYILPNKIGQDFGHQLEYFFMLMITNVVLVSFPCKYFTMSNFLLFISEQIFFLHGYLYKGINDLSRIVCIPPNRVYVAVKKLWLNLEYMNEFGAFVSFWRLI